MPKTERIVINTGPLISLIAAFGDLKVLESLYQRVLVPFEVCQEMHTGGSIGFGVAEFEQASFLHKWETPLELSPFLSNSLDRGEAAVIQLALNEKIQTVCIDEAIGRRIARLSGLFLTGSVGILIRAKQAGYPFSMRKAIAGMKEKGIWMSDRVIRFALEHAGKD